MAVERRRSRGPRCGNGPRTAGAAALAAVTALALVPGERAPDPAPSDEPRFAPVARPLTPPAPPGPAAPAPLPGPAAPGLPALPAAPLPGPGAPATLPDALAQLRIVYHRAEYTGTEYEHAARRLRAQRARTARLGRRLTRAREALGLSRIEAGRLAREQYQGHSELSALLRLLLSRDPRRAVDEQYLIERAADASRRALDRERTLAARQRLARDSAAASLRAVEALLASLTPTQITGLSAPGTRDTVLPAGTLTRDHPPTRAGTLALRYAIEQIGKPYLWGAEGPGAYDCSGLTLRAWDFAGVRIPRTSQEQWAGLPRVPLRSLRPGDLVIYFPGATHVGIYLGGGQVVHAPRPGATVKVSPIAANPLLGAVRPDPDGPPLPPGAFVPPPLPDGATAGTDTGWSQPDAPPADSAL